MENIPAQIKSLEDELHEPYEPTVKEIKKIATTIEDDDNKKRSDKAKQALKRKKMLRNQKAARLKEIFDEQERIKKLMSDIPARINSLQAESRKWDEPIGLKEQDISELRTQISELRRCERLQI
jgi:phosphoglycerate-specific signal transduction histidine kinase